jgi:hypothetical protein
MNTRTLATLGALVAIVVAAAVWLSMSRHPEQVSKALYPDLKAHLQEVTGIRIYTRGNQRQVELVRSDKGWTVTERSNYPADANKVRQLVLDLAEAKLLEEKTSDPAKYPTLNVQDVSAADATGVRVELVGVKDVDVILGKKAVAMNSRYVRKTADKTSWLVDRALDAPSEPKDWLDQEVLDIASDRIHSVRIEIEGKQPYTASKAARTDANFKVTNLKKGQSLSSESAANGLGSSLIRLNLDDVAPYTQWQDKKPQAKATYTTFDGIKLEITGWKDDNNRYIHVVAAYDESVAKQFAPAEKSEKDEKADKDVNQTAIDGKAETEKLQARLQPWVFQIPHYKYDTLFQPLEDLLKK